jgi:hypothetical protein
VTDKDCKALTPPARVLGRGCVDDAGMVDHLKWKVNDGNASRNTEQYETSYDWKVPQEIKAGGSTTLRVTARGLQGQSICPALAVARDFARAQIYKCSPTGGSLDESLTVKLVPPSGGTAKLMVWVTDGPDYTYFYRAGAASATPKKCRPRMRIPANANAEEKKCRYFVRFNFDVLHARGFVEEKTRGTGTFYVLMSANDTSACTTKGVMNIRHEHDPIDGDLIRVFFGSTEAEQFGGIAYHETYCLHLKGRGKKLTARIDASAGVPSEPNCGSDKDIVRSVYEGAVDIRAGEPFNLVHIELCNHREKYWAAGPHLARKVDVEIDIRPAGPK